MYADPERTYQFIAAGTSPDFALNAFRKAVSEKDAVSNAVATLVFKL
jgi:hypothetical protein